MKATHKKVTVSTALLATIATQKVSLPPLDNAMQDTTALVLLLWLCKLQTLSQEGGALLGRTVWSAPVHLSPVLRAPIWQVNLMLVHTHGVIVMVIHMTLTAHLAMAAKHAPQQGCPPLMLPVQLDTGATKRLRLRLQTAPITLYVAVNMTCVPCTIIVLVGVVSP